MKHEASKVDEIFSFFLLRANMQPYGGGGEVIELSYIKWKFLGYLEREVDACEFSFPFKVVRILTLISCICGS